MWFAHVTIPMILYYLLFPHLRGAFGLLFGAFFANCDALIVKLGLKSQEFHFESYFHSIPFGLVCSALFLPFGIKNVIAFNIGHLVHLLLDAGSDSGIKLFYPLKYSLSLNFWENSFSQGFKKDYIQYYRSNFIVEFSSFVILIFLLPKEIIAVFGNYKTITSITASVSLILFLFLDNTRSKYLGLSMALLTLGFTAFNLAWKSYFQLALIFLLFMTAFYLIVQEKKVEATLFYALTIVNLSVFAKEVLTLKTVPYTTSVIAVWGIIVSFSGIYIYGLLNKFQDHPER